MLVREAFRQILNQLILRQHLLNPVRQRLQCMNYLMFSLSRHPFQTA